MNMISYISLLLFYTYRYYKRIDLDRIRKELVSDLERCEKMLKMISDMKYFELHTNVLEEQVFRLNQLGYSFNFSIPEKELSCITEYYDLVVLMKKINKDMLRLAKSPFYSNNLIKIKKMLMAIHNVPRVFLDDDIQDATCSNIHISYEDAKNCILCYLGNKYISG